MNRKGLLFLALSVIIAISVTWLNSLWLTYQDFFTASGEKQIDYYLSDFSLLNTTSDGEMKYFIQGQHLVHRNTTGGSEIISPLIEAADSDGANLYISANKAEQLNKDGAIELAGAVEIEKTATIDNTTIPEFSLKTKDLIFNPNTRDLRSDATITLTTADGMITGKGLRSNLKQQDLKILSDVHAEFNPNP